ncbi:MAG: LysR family transcriptional regulator [Rhodospirillales bacterium]|nr:LysR family transcriptional regulator [Rhodospirillales bacterium]
MRKASRFRKRSTGEQAAEQAAFDDGKQVRLMIRVAFGASSALGPGKIRLMELIDEHGSITGAAKAMGMSYRRAWLLLKGLNEGFRDEVVSTKHGGNKGGGARLTPFGHTLLGRYREILDTANGAVAGDLEELEKDFIEWTRPPE